ncbi:MAG: hypothetical protein WC943_16510, partial [Elusimicrobiota bacterium]
MAGLICSGIMLVSPGMEGCAEAAGIVRTGPAAVPGISAAASAVGTIGSGLSARGVPAVPLGLPSILPGLGNAFISLPSIPAVDQARPESSFPQPFLPVELPPAQGGQPSISFQPAVGTPKVVLQDAGAISRAESAVPSDTLAGKVSEILGNAEQAWRRSFSAQPAVEDSGAPSESAARQPTISDDPAFHYWLKKSDHPHARLAAKLARNMTWDQVLLLSNQGGFQFLPGK